jgi:hypothetical protein
MKQPKTRIVSETNKGIYVWKLPTGEYLAEGLYILSIQSTRGDIKAMKTLAQAAAGYGFPDGTPEFQEGYRKISDEEFEIQYNRMLNGLVPDPMDEIKGL